jgi:hypothetical protein
MTRKEGGGGSVHEAVPTTAESAAAPRPVWEGNRAGSQTAPAIKAGTLLNIWLYFSRDAHVIASARRWKTVCLIWLDQKIDGAGGCLHFHVMHCGSSG